MKITKFRRTLLDRLAEASEDHPLELEGQELRAARWLVEHGLAKRADPGFYAEATAPAPTLATLAKPHVVATAGRWDIRFGAGRARIDFDEQESLYRWTATTEAGESFGESFHWDLAMLAAWSATAIFELPAQVELEAGELEDLIARARATVDDGVGIIRAALERRTGFRWSVRRGKGSRREAIYIKAASSRLVGTAMTGHDSALLGALLGLRSAINRFHGATIEARMGARADAVRSITGWLDPALPIDEQRWLLEELRR